MGLGARSACAATASVNVTLLAESSRRVGTAWPGAVCKGECGAGKAAVKDSRCESQTIDAALHNSLNLLESGSRNSRVERFTALTGRLVPWSGTEG
jgi:hypothetical protein